MRLATVGDKCLNFAVRNGRKSNGVGTAGRLAVGAKRDGYGKNENGAVPGYGMESASQIEILEIAKYELRGS